MTSTEILRLQVQKYIEAADEISLRRVQAILEIDQQEDFWTALPDSVREDVEEALLQSARGEGRSHEEVMKKYDRWRIK